MKSKQTTFGSEQARRIQSAEYRAAKERAEGYHPPSGRGAHIVSGEGAVPYGALVASLLILIFCLLTIPGCGNSAATAGPGEPSNVESVVRQELTDSDVPAENNPKRLARGEMPEEWIEPQRERVIPIDRTGDKLDLTFDDLKFDIEVGEAFERSLLSEEVKALDGKEITLGGYMRPSFKASGLKGFIFVRDDKECCFGPQAAIYDCVRVKLDKGTASDYIVQPFKVRGKFYLKEREGPDGAIWSIFNMKNAKIVR